MTAVSANLERAAVPGGSQARLAPLVEGGSPYPASGVSAS
jgi:hypothetical protein